MKKFNCLLIFNVLLHNVIDFRIKHDDLKYHVTQDVSLNIYVKRIEDKIFYLIIVYLILLSKYQKILSFFSY